MIICIRIDNSFSKTYPSFLAVKEGSTSLTNPLSCSKREDVTALRCSDRYAIRLADHQRSSLWLCGMGPLGDIIGELWF